MHLAYSPIRPKHPSTVYGTEVPFMGDPGYAFTQGHYRVSTRAHPAVSEEGNVTDACKAYPKKSKNPTPKWQDHEIQVTSLLRTFALHCATRPPL